MPLQSDDIVRIADLFAEKNERLIDRVSAAMDERIDRIEKIINDNHDQNEKRFLDHSERISRLERWNTKIAVVWTTIATVTAFVLKAIWDKYIQPLTGWKS